MSLTRPLDKLGRVVIPVEMRRYFSLRECDELIVDSTPTAIILTPRRKTCALCQEQMVVSIPYKKSDICPNCANELRLTLSTEFAY